MIYAAIIMICVTVLGMGCLYFILETRKHTKRERIVEKIGKLEDELENALLERKADVALHATLRTRIQRLRDEAQAI